MSCIDKLLIRGIRSFDPDSSNVIEFYSPLTLIIGHNGSGKTTIIECLKYATTGDLPPNSKNGAFIHDPKIYHEAETKAQVKLRFKNVNGKQLVCTRSMSLTQKKTTVSQKTLESMLMMKNELGEQVSISNRCAELDAEIPNQLGVSKSILENVIFCHQEESFWPMSEPAVLKKKFDEIFAATKYTKALDNIKSLRKEQAVTLKLEQQNLDHLKLDKERAERVKVNVDAIKKKIQEKKARIEQLQVDQIASLEKKIATEAVKQQQIHDLRLKKEQLQHEQATLEQSIKELQLTLVEYDESDEKLQEILSEYLNSSSSRKQEADRLTVVKQSLDCDVSGLNDRYSALRGSQGRVQAQQDNYYRRLSEKEELLRELRDLSDRKQLDLMFDENGTSAVDSLKNKLIRLHSRNDMEKSDFRARQNDLMQVIQTAKAKISLLQTTKESKLRQQSEFEAEMTEMLVKLAQLNNSQSKMASVEAQASSLNKHLTELNAEYAALDVKPKTTHLQAQISQSEQRMMTISSQMTSLGDAAGAQAEISFIKQEHSSITAELSQKTCIVKPEIKKVLGYAPNQLDTCASELDNLLNIKNLELSQSKAKMQAFVTQQAILDSQLDSLNKELILKQHELDDCQLQLDSACAGSDYVQFLNSQQETVDQLKTNLSEMQTAYSMYSKFVEKASELKACPLCKRGYDTKKDEDSFVSTLKTTVDKLPARVKQAQDALNHAMSICDRLKQLSSVHHTYLSLKTLTVPELSHQLSSIKQEIVQCSNNAESSCRLVECLSSEIETCTSVQQQVQVLCGLQEKAVQLSSKMSLLQSTCSENSGPSLSDLSREFEQAKESCQHFREQLLQVQSMAETMQALIKTKQDEFAILNREKDLIRKESQESFVLQSEIEHKKLKSNQIQAEIQQFTIEFTQLKPFLLEKEGLMSNLSKVFECKQQENSLLLRQLQEYSQRLNIIDSEVTGHADSMNALEICNKEMASVELNLKAKKQELEQMNERISKLEKQYSQVQVLQRNVDDNLRFRRMTRQFQALATRIDSVTNSLDNINAAQVELHLRNLKSDLDKLVTERAGLVGEQRQLEEQLSQTQRELEADYGNVEKEYEQQYFKCQTEELANSDLEKYAKALDTQV